MKTLFSLITVIGLGSGAAAWQQQSIHHLRQEIAQLSSQIIATRSALDGDQARLIELKQRLRQLHAHPVPSTSDTIITADTSTLPDPQSEGWWPKDKPYFYLHKDILKTVRLHDLRFERMNPKPGTPTLGSITNRLFQEHRLNEHMATLLGMTETEKNSIEQTYDNLTQQVRALEAAAIQRVEPPQSNDVSGAVFARIPALTSEVSPLVKQALESSKQILGAERANYLAQQSQIYFNQNHDGLGSVTREFLQNGGGLSVRYTDAGGNTSFRSETFPYAPNRTDEWEYLHLFGPNGPVELK